MTLTARNENEYVLHLRLDGQSTELPLASLGLDLHSTDDQVKQALANHLDRPADAFSRYVVVRYSTAIVVRPEAVYG